MMKKDKRSPLKDKPLRLPGQSIDDEIEKVLDDQVMPYILVAVFFLVFTLLVWSWAFLPRHPDPKLLTFVTALLVPFCIYKIVKAKKHLNALKLGRDGERIVGQYLDSLRSAGYRIFHDIVAEGFNVDHVVISPKGIYAIETKTYSKPGKGKPVVVSDGQTLLIDGRQHDRNPVEQIKAASRWLSEMLAESTGKGFNIYPVILFPGWYVEGGLHPDLLVLNPKGFPKILEQRNDVLDKGDMQLAAYHLSRYIRAR